MSATASKRATPGTSAARPGRCRRSSRRLPCRPAVSTPSSNASVTPAGARSSCLRPREDERRIERLIQLPRCRSTPRRVQAGRRQQRRRIARQRIAQPGDDVLAAAAIRPTRRRCPARRAGRRGSAFHRARAASAKNIHAPSARDERARDHPERAETASCLAAVLRLQAVLRASDGRPRTVRCRR